MYSVPARVLKRLVALVPVVCLLLDSAKVAASGPPPSFLAGPSVVFQKQALTESLLGAFFGHRKPAAELRRETRDRVSLLPTIVAGTKNSAEIASDIAEEDILMGRGENSRPWHERIMQWGTIFDTEMDHWL